jgi:4-amino-4-deoxy-L-arabinose transferase-like glycosyltransferase
VKPKWLWTAMALILLLAVFLRVDFLRSVQHLIPHDTFHYDEMVRQWLHTGVYGYKDTHSNAQVTPGYPVIMAAVYELAGYQTNDPFPYLRYLNVVLSLGTLWLVFLMARRWAGDAASLLAALAMAVYPSFVWTTGSILTEVPTAFMLTLYLYVQLIAFESRLLKHAVLAGVLLGLTALIRPEFMPLFIPLYLFYWLQTRDRTFWKPMAAALIGLAVIMSPWWIRNMVVMDRLILTGTQTNPFYAGTFPYKNWEDGLVDNNGKTQKEIGIERLKVGFTKHPGLFIRWYTIGKLEYTYGRMFIHLAIILTGLLGMILSWRRWRHPLTLLSVVVVVMSGVRLLFIPEYRYNFTVMPLIILFSAYAAVKVWQWAVLRFAPPVSPVHRRPS